MNHWHRLYDCFEVNGFNSMNTQLFSDRRSRGIMETDSRYCQQDKFDRLHDGYSQAFTVGRWDATSKFNTAFHTIFMAYVNVNAYANWFGFVSRNWPNARQTCMQRLLNYKKRCHKSPKLRKFWRMPKTLRIPRPSLKKSKRNSA